MLKRFLLIVSLFISTSTFAQSIPWEEKIFQEEVKGSTERALEIAHHELLDAQEVKDMASVAQALNDIGLIHLTGSMNSDQSLDFFIKALTIEDSLNLPSEKVITYIGIARVFENVGDYHKCVQYLESALEISGVNLNTSLRVRILNKLGKAYSVLGRLEDGFDTYRIVLTLSDEINDATIKADALFNQAHLFTLQNKYEEALASHREALSLRRTYGNKQEEAVSLNEIGLLYTTMRNKERAIANHQASLKIRTTIKDKAGMAESLNNLGILQFDEKNYNAAIRYLKQAIDLGLELPTREHALKSADYLAQCYKELKDYTNAYRYKELYSDLHDFILSDKSDRQIQEAQNRYLIDKRETQIEKLELIRKQDEQKIAAQEQFNRILFVVILLVVIIAFLFYRQFKLKQRASKILEAANNQVRLQNIELQNLNATKDKFFSIISHDLKGPLNSLTSFSGLLINHSEHLTKEEIQVLAKDLDKSLKNLFALLENLLEWSRSQTGNIEFKQEPFDLSVLLKQNRELLLQQAQNKGINLINANTKSVVVNAHENSINTVIRNLISNAIKFTPNDGMIMVDVTDHGVEWVVSIADNGVGMSKEVMDKLFRIDTKHSTKGTSDEKGTGLGLILCKDFVEKNGGRIWVESEVNKGSIFFFTIPKRS
jgi:signal transduction histidine kinase